MNKLRGLETCMKQKRAERSARFCCFEKLLLAHEVFKHHLVQSSVIAISNQLLGFGFVEGASLLHKHEEGLAAVLEVSQPMLGLGGAERMHVKGNILAFAAVFVAFQSAHLIESATQIVASKRLVLVELEAVLVVQMQ